MAAPEMRPDYPRHGSGAPVVAALLTVAVLVAVCAGFVVTITLLAVTR